MIIITGTFHIKSERWEEAVSIAKELVAKSRTDEGCIRYTFSEPLDEPYHFFCFEVWASPEALEKHKQTPHLRTFFAFLQQAASRPFTLEKYVQATEIVVDGGQAGSPEGAPMYQQKGESMGGK